MALVTSKNLYYRRFLLYGLNRKNTVQETVYSVFISRPISSVGNLSSTTLIMQNGDNIQEVPLVVRKVCSNDATKLLLGDNSNNTEDTVVDDNKSSNANQIAEEEELQEIVNGFQNCNSFNEILKLLEIVPSSYVNARVAFEILKRMTKIDSLNVSNSKSGEDVANNFTKTAVYNQLFGIILSNKEPSVCLDCLLLWNRNTVFREYAQPYFEKLTEQILLNTTENKYNIEEFCVAVPELFDAGKSDIIDNLWMGITENSKNIDEKNIMRVYNTLPFFNKSRALIAITLQRKLSSLWWNISNSDAANILLICKETKSNSYLFLQIMAKLLNTKIHSMSENHLLSFVSSFYSLNYVNSQIITALGRYIRFKGMNINEHLFGVIMDYCVKFRVCSSLILEKCCDYFIQNGREMTPSVIRSMFVPFGILNYNPTRSYQFWKVFEEVLHDQFPRFTSEHILDIMLSCVYLEKYPINFMNYIFNPDFLNRLQMSCRNWNVTKAHLKLLDQAMTLECKSYDGPLLFRDINLAHASVEEGLRLFVNQMSNQFSKLVGPTEEIQFFKIAHRMPIIDTYLIDILITPVDKTSTKPSSPIALLLHVPSHYVYQSEQLIGPQMLRRRHLKLLGFKVLSLNYVTIAEMRSHPSKMLRYIKKEIADELMN